MSIDENKAAIGRRLREERERLGLSQEDLAAIGDITRRTQGLYEKGERMPDADYLARLGEKNVDLVYVIRGNRYLVELKQYAKPADESAGGLVIKATEKGNDLYRQDPITEVGDAWRPAVAVVPPEFNKPLVMPVQFRNGTTREFEVIPKLMAEASAGPRRGNGHDAVIEAAGIMALDRQWMLDNFGRPGEGYATVQVHGDSMEPTLYNGETIVIDTQVSRVDVSGIYVLKAGNDVLVKRVQRKFDGTLVLKSDNSAYEPETLSPVEAAAVEVKGRMVWPRVR